MTQKDLLSTVNVDEVKTILRNEGCYLIENAFDRAFCDRMIEFIENHRPDEKTEFNYEGTEVRIWDSQKRHPELETYFNFSNRFMQPFLQNGVSPTTLLAIRNQSIANQEKKLAAGRWHIDSFRQQIKLFLFLNDTQTESGAFEFIPKTHRPAFKLKMLCFGYYIKPKDFLTGKRSYQKFDESFLNKIISRGHSPQPVVCKAGTLMIVDTSAIHRARPCYQGSRYALTTYYV